MTNNITIARVGGTSMNVNSYLVESKDSLVVVDGMLTLHDAQAVRRHIDERQKPLRGLIVTHAHPDHYAGAAEILQGQPNVPILATEPVAKMIERDDATKDRIIAPMIGAEWPQQRRFPNRIVSDRVELGDLVFAVRDLGPGESPADSLWSLNERTLFVGDLVYNGMHAYLADGFHQEWLATLDKLERELDPAVTLYVGHGEPTGKAAIAAQKEYILRFLDAVRRHRQSAPDARRSAVLREMREYLPSEDLLFLMDLSITPVAEQMNASD
ncbi:MAG: MBL fold metallo-hydrolase [Myxococcota bacterium]